MGNRTDVGMKRPLFWGGLTAMAITAVALRFSLWMALAAALVLLLWFWHRRGVLCLFLTVSFLLLAVGYRHWYIAPTRSLDGQTDVITGVVEEESSYGKMFTVRVTDSTLLRKQTRIVLLCNGDEKPALYATVVAKVRLYAVEDEQSYYASQGAFVRAFPADYAEDDLVVIGSTETVAHRWMHRVRMSLLAPCRETLGNTESAVLAAVCFGERSFLDTATEEAFRGSGLSHLLVVSGLHVSMVALALRGLFRRLGRRWACLLTLVGVWLYAWLVGFSPSVLRAATMCSVWLVGQFLFCRSDGLSSLGLAAVVVLAMNPCAVWNVGCQLSFAATMGVLLLSPRLTPHFDIAHDMPWWHRLWQFLRKTAVSGAVVCLSALLFTLPIAAYHYDGFSLATVVSNVLAVAPIGAMMALGWLGTLCGLVPFLGWLGKGLLLLAGLLARYTTAVARICSPAWAWVSVTQPWQWLLIFGVCAIAVCGILCCIPRRRVLAVLALFAVTAFCIGTPLTASRIRMTVLSSDNEGAFVIEHGDRCALLLTHGSELDEAVYGMPRFTPDAVFLNAASAEDVARLGRFPDAAVFVTDEVAQMTADRAVTACPMGSTVTLWEGCRLTLMSAVWWCLQMDAETVYICTDPKAEPLETENMCIYVGGTPAAPPPQSYAVVCSKAWLRRYHPSLTGRETFIIEEPITLIPDRGEWRVSPWR